MGFKTRMDPLTRLLCRCLMVCFHCPTPMSIHILIPILIICRKAPLGLIPMVIPMQSYHENYLKNHHIGTDICVKLGTVPICIRIGIRIGSVGTVLHIVTARKWSLRRLCFYTCLPVILFTGGVRGCGGHAWLQGACVVAGGACVVVGGMHGCGGAYIVAGGMRGCRGGMHGGGGHAWDTTKYGQSGGGTHPTGMHSCYISHLNWNRNRNRSRAVKTNHYTVEFFADRLCLLLVCCVSNV